MTEANRDNVFQNKDIEIDLSIQLNGEYKQTIYTLDESTSALHNWVKIGAPLYPTQKQLQGLKEASKPLKEISVIDSFEICETLKLHEVKMFVLDKYDA